MRFAKFLQRVLLVMLVLTLVLIGYFFIGSPPQAEEIVWGVNFSQKHARDLGLDWRETYSLMLDDLLVRNIKLLTHWDLLEPARDGYFFDDLDWQISEAEKKNAKIILVVGMKTGRWPECHIPDWAQNLPKEEQQKEVLSLIETVILRYRDSKAIKMWQVENEPLFYFGVCPWQDKEFLAKEIALVKALDTGQRQVMVSDSGELSLWLEASSLGDVVGTTMYRKTWSSEFQRYVSYPLKPIFYWRKAKFVDRFFNKRVIVAELQAEPWGLKLLYDSPRQEQEKTMNLEQFRQSVDFARKTGLDEFYFWGVEWWHWLKKNFPQEQDALIWETAGNLFKEDAL